MQTYIIKSFKEITSRLVFTKDDRSGNYLNGIISKSLMDFMCDGAYEINSILRTSDQQLFTIGDRLTTIDGNIINKIKITNGEVILHLFPRVGNNNHPSIKLNNAIKYIEPVAVVEEKPKRKYTKKADKFNELEKAIIAQFPRTIRLENLLRSTATKPGLQGFLIKFFKEWNAEKRTIYKDDSSLQTPVGRRRSLGDVYILCKYYFPEVTLKEVIEQLYVELPKIITRGYRSCKCGQIHKRVWYYQEGGDNAYNNSSDQDEYNNTREWYIDNLN